MVTLFLECGQSGAGQHLLFRRHCYTAFNFYGPVSEDNDFIFKVFLCAIVRRQSSLRPFTCTAGL